MAIECKDDGSEGSTRAAGRVKCGAKRPKRTGSSTCLVLLLGIGVVGSAVSAPNTDSIPASKAPTQTQVLAALHISEIAWHKGGFNNIMMLNAKVQNSGAHDVKDIKIVCDHTSSGEAKVDSNSATIYGPFPAGKSKSIHEFDMGVFHDQATATNCSIVHATPMTKRWGRAAR